jgi:hypothetical protein
MGSLFARDPEIRAALPFAYVPNHREAAVGVVVADLVKDGP